MLWRQQPCVSQDILHDERFSSSHAFGVELGLRSIFSYPLVTGATVYGVLLLCSTEAGGLTPLKSDILSLFASQATIAIHNGKLLDLLTSAVNFKTPSNSWNMSISGEAPKQGNLSSGSAAIVQRLHEQRSRHLASV